ncbi:Gti1/Pac2 family-domain-containing protein [Paraphoma chrysanthemicola]|uniref:Gti1/Pac2 family-domain-containing protein n=1 Tax=Paraphoma chrysanthemicola TaxID=798071 RepID=A0A8K0R6P6_9PLEO|nr:Gti1/Pac2 family-domain-containing protein [Paraphoma chrysanthemicola]
MLQGIRASTLTMPPFGHEMSHSGAQKVEGYSDTDAWAWPPPSAPQHSSYSNVFDPSIYANFTPSLQPPNPRVPLRHISGASSHSVATGTAAPPPSRSHGPPNMIKAQPAFKPTWQGFLDTTKDAMTVVEAALQGRLSHISRRPHDKERAEMLTSGTVLVYEENASGIKRWTDAVHWSPSRVMNNCLIYRQLVRALKPDEKKTALNPSCGTKRKRKESAGPTITKTGDHVNNSDDEFESPLIDGVLTGDTDSANKVYANFAQSLTPDQQRRFCGSLIDSYEFKEGGLMKKTISVKYQGTHHHVISYYSLEDVVNGKLKRPFQDAKLSDIQPRPELLAGWKVSLEDEESKDMPLVAGYGQHMQPSHLQHHVIGAVSQAVGHTVAPTHAPLHLHVSDYWHGPQASQYTPAHQSSHHYAPPQTTAPQYTASAATNPYSGQQSTSQAYAPQYPPSQQHVQPPSPQHYPSPQTSSPQYPVQAATPQPYASQSQPARHYSYEAQQPTTASQYAQPSTSQYASVSRSHMSQPSHYSVPQASTFDVHVPGPPGQAVSQDSSAPHDHQRRSSAPVALQSYSQPHYSAPPHPESYYVADQKYTPTSHQGY